MQQQNAHKTALPASVPASVPAAASVSTATTPRKSGVIARSGELSLPPRSIEDLPPANTRRWVMRRKAQVVFGVKIGLLSVQDACARYGLTEEEFGSWRSLVENHGLNGLRVTRLQQYRRGGTPDSLIGATGR